MFLFFFFKLLFFFSTLSSSKFPYSSFSRSFWNQQTSQSTLLKANLLFLCCSWMKHSFAWTANEFMVFLICPLKLVNYRGPTYLRRQRLQDSYIQWVQWSPILQLHGKPSPFSHFTPPTPHTQKDSSNFLHLFHKKDYIFWVSPSPGEFCSLGHQTSLHYPPPWSGKSGGSLPWAQPVGRNTITRAKMRAAQGDFMSAFLPRLSLLHDALLASASLKREHFLFPACLGWC